MRGVLRVLAILVVVAGCSTAEPRQSATPSPGSSATAVLQPSPTSTAVPATPAPTAELPVWQTTELRDVRSGETLRIADLTNRVVVVEPMAIWCTNCRAQQDEARAALAALGGDDIVYISIDVDPNEAESDLARYADDRGYGWHFVVASVDVARSLAESFGDQVLSPPSTPKILITPDGAASVSFGFKSAAELEAELAAHLP